MPLKGLSLDLLKKNELKLNLAYIWTKTLEV